MELIFADRYYDSEKWEQGKYGKELTVELFDFDKTVTVTDTDIGHGADFPAILVQIFNNVDWTPFLISTGASSFFLLGEKINKNLDAWIEIGKKFKRLIEKFHPIRVDENVAILMVLNDVFEKADSAIEFNVSLQIVEFTSIPWGKGRLDKRPDALYLIVLKSLSKIFVYGVTSKGEIEFKHEFSTEWLQF